MNTENPIILCVDDEEANLRLLEKILLPRGYTVTIAASGEEALQKIKSEAIDLILLDVLMPGMDGFEVCRLIKNDQKLKNIPVIIVTSLSAKQDRIRGIEAGAEEFLTKPFDPTDVLARIKLLLKVKQLNIDIARTKEALQKSNDNLEYKVMERTEGLAQANEILEASSIQHKPVEEILQLRNRAINSLSQGMFITDPSQPDNPIVDVNPSFLQITGYERDDVIGKNCRFLQGPQTAPEAIERIRSAVQDGKPCGVELLNYRKDGTSFWNGLSISPICDEAGRIEHFVGVLTSPPAR